MSIATINVLAELETIGWSFKWSDEANIKCKCPFHTDNSPSLFINMETRKFYCQSSGCNKKGDIVTFLAKACQTTRALMLQELAKRYTIETTKVINADLIEIYHRDIDNAAPLIKELKLRGVGPGLIRKYRLGELDGRITIPIKNETGLYVNVRKYLPGAPGTQKMRNVRGHGQIRLFPIDQLRYDEIVICGGEIKAIVAAAELNPYSIGAITVTSGEGKWDPKFSKLFADKKVYICMDIDEAGTKAANQLASLLYKFADWIGIVKLPLDKDKYPTGDLNDYVAREGEALKPVLDSTDEWQPKTKALDATEKPKEVTLNKAIHADNVGARIAVEATLSAVDTTPFAIPHKLVPNCCKEQKMCAICPVYNLNDNTEVVIDAESEAILELTSATKQGLRGAIMGGIGVPATCKTFDYSVTASYNVEEARISPKLEINSASNERSMIPAICIGDGMQLNENYRLTGRLWPSPKDQKQTLVISDYKTSEDALSSYVPKDLHELEVFQPDEWTEQSISAKLDELYSDLEANVTRIYLRRSIHIVADLTYHSPLWLQFDGKVHKGWVESLIIGDSAQGKSETVLSLRSFYGLGEKVECKNATVAGLLGGLQMMGTKWFVSWGIIPTHDSRLVILEELKGADVEVISKLTDMRSSGVAEIPKIEKRRTHARTRLIALSNPRHDLPLSSYNYGVEAVKELVGALEDVRRFDIVAAVARNDIDADKLNQLTKHRPDVAHKHTADLCRRLILFGWTVKNTEFEDQQFILDKASELTAKFSDTIPIVDRGSQRLKIARLAAALAVRTFSTKEGAVYVRTCHVEWICNFLDEVYSADSLGYKDYTQAVKITSSIKDPDVIKSNLQAAPHPQDLVEQLLANVYIDLQGVMDWTGYDRGLAQELLSLLVRKHAIQRFKRVYRKIGAFTELLKEMIEKNEFHDKPTYLKKERF